LSVRGEFKSGACTIQEVFASEKGDRIMKEFVAYIVKNLVDHPDKVRINEVGGTQTLIIELAVEKSDIGKIIGKEGRTINAIRTLLMSVASRNGIRVSLEIIEEDKASSSGRPA
jgi:uncharacterized protein